jgi:hypothetical protein
LFKGVESHDIPPTKDALILHTKQANFQAYVWKRALDGNVKLQVQMDMGAESSKIYSRLSG